MRQDYLLVGTAGHVDHGKTQLIQALTGISTDRLKEEKERGISIELGFAHFDLPGGKRVGIVDVPGHERFIRQMLAGASGMDVVLLVIAADEGVMPQTQEHIDILDLLEIKNGIVVITKLDIVDEEWLLLVEQDIRENIKGSFLEKAPVCKVSSVTGEGIPELIQTIKEVLEKSQGRRTDLPARMPIDRVFTIQGFGTVVTGTLHSGFLQKGQEVAVEPGGYVTKVRNIQVHSNTVTEVLAGQRAAINIAGLEVKDIKRGMNVVSPGRFTIGNILDVQLMNLPKEQRTIKQRQRIHFYLGTTECIGRIHLLNQKELSPGETCFAQIILEESVLAAFGDRFVVRYYSPVATIGGGAVLGVAPSKRKRFREEIIQEFRIKAKGDARDSIRKELIYPFSVKEIILKTGLGKEQIEEALTELEKNSEVVILMEDNNSLYWLKSSAERWGTRISNEAAKYQREYPLRGRIGREELKHRLKIDISLKRWQLVLEWEAASQMIKMSGGFVESLPIIKLPEKILSQIECLLKKWDDAGLNPPEYQEASAGCGIPGGKFEEYAGYLIAKGFWIKVGEYYFSIAAVENAKKELKNYLMEKEQATVSEVRELWGTTRKYTVPLLEYFDSVRFTKREELVRRLYEVQTKR
ncbi:MAG: Selenocysteine-specific elongation factor [Candidatus Dichloromethanomonas elyunquensis]|nr:MAG: Selenocysteine-specific elongation factor [Candidatus Dichloromethanomonas elyunquensis]